MNDLSEIESLAYEKLPDTDRYTTGKTYIVKQGGYLVRYKKVFWDNQFWWMYDSMELDNGQGS